MDVLGDVDGRSIWLGTRRGVVLASIAKGPARFGVASVHLGLDPAERARHLTDITGLMNRLIRPSGLAAASMEGAPVPVAVVAGDINEAERAPTWRRLAAQYRDAGAGDSTPTFSTARPRHRIDGVFVRGSADVASYRVLDAPLVQQASDHRPVVVDLVVLA
jgi:endonuclease/exonuclease/phosphatase family metal-dependent hydrolase